MYRLLAIIICLTLILFNFSNNAYAETSYVYFNGKHHLAGGVGRYGKDTKYFWISDKLSGFLYNCAKDAMLDWSNNSSIIDFKITKSRPDSVVDIYCSNDGKNAGYNAYTVFRKGLLTYVDPDKENWKYSQIYYNLDNNLNTNQSINRDRIIAVFAHEIGHSFGLDENNSNKNSIMCQAGSGRAVTNVQSCDFTGVFKLYK